MMILIVLLWVVCGIGAAILAYMKDRSPSAWFFAGLLFGPAGLIAAALAGERHEPTSNRVRSNGIFRRRQPSRHW